MGEIESNMNLAAESSCSRKSKEISKHELLKFNKSCLRVYNEDHVNEDNGSYISKTYNYTS